MGEVDLWDRIERLVRSIAADAIDDDADTREAWQELERYLDRSGGGAPDGVPGDEARDGADDRSRRPRSRHEAGRQPGTAGRRAAGAGPGVGAATLPPAVRQACHDLEVKLPIDESGLRRAYRAQLKQYHPDRYEEGSPAYRDATEVTRRLTLAYRTIREYYFR